MTPSLSAKDIQPVNKQAEPKTRTAAKDSYLTCRLGIADDGSSRMAIANVSRT